MSQKVFAAGQLQTNLKPNLNQNHNPNTIHNINHNHILNNNLNPSYRYHTLPQVKYSDIKI